MWVGRRYEEITIWSFCLLSFIYGWLLQLAITGNKYFKDWSGSHVDSIGSQSQLLWGPLWLLFLYTTLSFRLYYSGISPFTAHNSITYYELLIPTINPTQLLHQTHTVTIIPFKPFFHQKLSQTILHCQLKFRFPLLCYWEVITFSLLLISLLLMCED